MRKIRITFIIAFLTIIYSCNNTPTTLPQIIRTKNQKKASNFTIEKNNELLTKLNFEDSTDFINANQGLIDTLKISRIINPDGSLSYDTSLFDFIKGSHPTTTNPSLWRQSQLNAIHGLFRVKDDRILQVRGYDLANMSLVRSDNGWIVIDPLTTPATAKKAMELVNKNFGTLPIKAILFTHSHVDHFGGVRGLTDFIDDDYKILAPEGFFDSSISENVMAGNAMSRRASYMYGNIMTKDTLGTLGSGLGTTTSNGITGIVEPTIDIKEEQGESMNIDGVNIEFIYTPESEAPAEMMFYFRDLKAFCQSENVSHTLHNLYTLRGAQVRNGQKWSKYIDLSISKWGDQAEISFGSHHWPTWGNDNILKFLKKQRDTYRYIHDQTLRLSNQGYTPRELSSMIQLPDSLSNEFYNRDYYGTVKHNTKAQYQLYFGWFDGNPANLNPLTPKESGKKYVEAIGGASKLLETAQKSFDRGEYQWVAELVNNLVFADTTNTQARYLLADTYEQLGYQAESGPWRNFYLTGAKELRNGIHKTESVSTASPDMTAGMSNELYFNYLGMQFKGTENSNLDYNFNINLTQEGNRIPHRLALIVSNGAVTPRMDKHVSENVTATITTKRISFDKLMSGESTVQDLIDSGEMELEGSQSAFTIFMSKLDTFNFWFNIVLP